jgi:hypothetical protein
MVDNPDFQGEWHAKKIENPAYKGEWAPKQVANPAFEEGVQLAAYESAMLGFELWIVNNGTIFDNILVTDDIEYAKAQVRGKNTGDGRGRTGRHSPVLAAWCGLVLVEGNLGLARGSIPSGIAWARLTLTPIASTICATLADLSRSNDIHLFIPCMPVRPC